MKGKYHIVIHDNKLKYDFWVERNITVIKGKSGSGKSTLFVMFEDLITKGVGGIHCNLKDKIAILNNPRTWKHDIISNPGRIIVVDEWMKEVFSQEFANIAQSSDNYFIIISRSSRMTNLTYSVNSVYELEARKEGNLFCNSLKERYLDDHKTVTPDLVITEDKCSGNQMFQGILKCNVISASGKDTVKDTIEENEDNYRSICAIVDGAAFGSLVESVCRPYIGSDKVTIIAPESFEYLLLNSKTFLKMAQKEITETYNYCDSTEYLSWERYYTALIKKLCVKIKGVGYAKSKLPAMFKNKLFKDVIQRQLSIAEEVYKEDKDLFK